MIHPVIIALLFHLLSAAIVFILQTEPNSWNEKWNRKKKKKGGKNSGLFYSCVAMSRFSSSSALSLRQSLGMPIRSSFASDESRPLEYNRKSKIPSGKLAGSHESSQRRQTLTAGHGGSRRQTQVLSRSSTGRCVLTWPRREKANVNARAI